MKILLATDGSRFADFGTTALSQFIRPQGAEVLVLQALQRWGPDLPATPKERVTARETVETAAQMLQVSGFVVSTRIVDGEPAAAILDAAAEWVADLIVLGSHGRTGIKKFLIGSVAETVARNASCSVWIARPMHSSTD